MLKKKLLAAAAAALVLGSSLTACGNAAEAGSNNAASGEAIKFNWGTAQGSYLAFYVASERGYFQAEGLDPTFQVFQTGTPLLAGLESKSLDIVTTGLASVFALGQGIPLRYITLEGDASSAEGLVVAKDSPIASVKDLAQAGKIGVPTGTCAQVSAYHAAAAAGLKYSDLDTVNISPNLFANAFESKSIGAGFSWSPYLVDLEQQGNKLIGFDTEWVPGGGACPEMHAGRPEFLDAHPEVPQKMLRALSKARADINADSNVATQVLMKRLSVSEAVAKETARRYIAAQPTLQDELDAGTRFSFTDEKGLLAQLTLASETFAQLGVIKTPVPVDTLKAALDSRYIKAAVAAGVK
ncbi:ABC transporter substrate-binding protein [Arthrobacter sp. 35W]|uniref:ABC transporter substrate-binding protein n=1 Tax=Arthrobacter sp. 35W TaxID=1132441 RepID=UPI000423DC4E|nr:ABC transporter substrate-binding protein [Arthrobacter sp. 35W]